MTKGCFAIWANVEKPAFWELLPGILDWARSRSQCVHLTSLIVSQLPDRDRYTFDTINSADDFLKMDFVLTLGGDGTILSAARAVADRNIPILGIHLGDLGFLAEVTVNDFYNRLEAVIAGDYSIQQRQVLNCTIYNNDQVHVFHALNDVVVDKGKSNRMITTQLLVNQRFVATYKADGLIVATPTGSTAYSLAAGGPIVVPGISAMVVSPICPHSLTYRPLVLPDDTVIEITFPESQRVSVAVTIDGQIAEYLENSPRICVRKADYQIPMIKFADSNYFHTLRTKMGWGRRGDN
ncbi:MAG: NAD(+)/NADH kinase [Candidatus Neomarinimicrobiota bacterium]